MRYLWAWPLVILAHLGSARATEPRIPILYSTDLFHPHADPDDHYDLACLFALPELDIRGIILDLGATQTERCGRPAVEQLMAVSGRKAPIAIGLSRRFRNREDRGLEEPPRYQAAVELILSTLRESKEKVILFTTGSCRDVAAAFNRQPELCREKIRAIYFNIGRGPNEPQEECNVGYDPESYLRLFESGLPIYWCPCFGKDGYQTLYTADQKTVVGACSAEVHNYFVYCLSRSKEDPIAFLRGGPRPTPTGPRNMWCTAPMLHAAGRKVFQRGADDFLALPALDVRARQLTEVVCFGFEPMRASLGAVRPAQTGNLMKPPAGALAAAFCGRSQDRVGTNSLKTDGKPDCCLRVLGIEPGRAIRNVVVTGPKEGRWESVATGRWWRIAMERKEASLDAWFQFWAAGNHRVEIVYGDGATQSATFDVPNLDSIPLEVELRPARPNGQVFRVTDARYPRIMESCLKNLLAELGR